MRFAADASYCCPSQTTGLLPIKFIPRRAWSNNKFVYSMSQFMIHGMRTRYHLNPVRQGLLRLEQFFRAQIPDALRENSSSSFDLDHVSFKFNFLHVISLKRSCTKCFSRSEERSSLVDGKLKVTCQYNHCISGQRWTMVPGI